MDFLDNAVHLNFNRKVSHDTFQEEEMKTVYAFPK